MSNDLIRLLVALVIVSALALLGNGLMLELDDSTDGLESQQQEIAYLDGSEWIDLNDGEGYDESVTDSRGLALRFDGTDESYVESDSPIDVASDDTWTVSQPVLDMHEANETQTVLAIGDPNLILQYVERGGKRDLWSAYFITTTDSYRANVTVNASTDKDFIYVTRNQTNVTIWRNDLKGESVNVSADNHVSGDLTAASNCNCTLDETRTFDDVLNSTQKTQLRDQPVKPLAGTNRTARLMYDEGDWVDDRTVHIFWSSAQGTRGKNTSYVTGFAGNELHRESEMLNSDDYVWDNEGPRMRPLAEYQEAPVLYVDYTFESAASQIRHAWTDTMDLVGLTMQVLMMVFILGTMVAFRRSY